MSDPPPDPLYVAARHVLLDGLEALGDQRQAAIIIGAHAVYMRVGHGDLATTLYTTDADLALNPSILGGHPPLNQALAEAGFEQKIGVSGPIIGCWEIEQQVDGRPVVIALDLLVAEAVSGGGTRAARLGSQGDRLARKAVGLELALVDSDLMTVSALDDDPRQFEVRVAGVAALLISKAYKVEERLDDPKRDTRIAKDCLDMLRLLRDSDPRRIAEVLRDARDGGCEGVDDALRASIAAIVEGGLATLRTHFSTERGRGCVLAGQAVLGRDDPDVIAASLAALVTRLLDRM